MQGFETATLQGHYLPCLRASPSTVTGTVSSIRCTVSPSPLPFSLACASQAKSTCFMGGSLAGKHAAGKKPANQLDIAEHVGLVASVIYCGTGSRRNPTCALESRLHSNVFVSACVCVDVCIYM